MHLQRILPGCKFGILAVVVMAALLWPTSDLASAEGQPDGIVAVGDLYSCAVTTVGGVKCWGHNDFGQLGDGTVTDRTTPVDVLGLAGGVVAVSATGSGFTSQPDHTCALTTAGSVKCWGGNTFGQLGDGTTFHRLTPVDVCADVTCAAHLTGVAAVSVGFGRTCALTMVGGVKCWGANFGGALGDGTTADRLTPVDVCADATCTAPLSGAAAISAGFVHTCALTTVGGLKCWGGNFGGQLGDGTTTTRLTPVDVCAGATCAASLTGVAAVSAGEEKTCALTTAGSVKCWGWNSFGQLGNGTSDKIHATPVDVCADAACTAPLTGVAAVSAGYVHACAITTVGGLKCWGGNFQGMLGNGTATGSLTPVDVCGNATCTGPLTGVAAVSAGILHTCALTTAGSVKCWGWNADGQLGEGTTMTRLTPVDVVGLDVKTVGGFSVDLDRGDLPLKTGESSGGSVGVAAGIAGVAAGAIGLGGAAWYVRRRRVGH